MVHGAIPRAMRAMNSIYSLRAVVMVPSSLFQLTLPSWRQASPIKQSWIGWPENRVHGYEPLRWTSKEGGTKSRFLQVAPHGVLPVRRRSLRSDENADTKIVGGRDPGILESSKRWSRARWFNVGLSKAERYRCSKGDISAWLGHANSDAIPSIPPRPSRESFERMDIVWWNSGLGGRMAFSSRG